MFNRSYYLKNELSINGFLESGPCLLPLLHDVLLRFRLGSIEIIADIRQAFLQILVDPNQRDYLRLLWLNFDSNDPDFYIYRFTRVLLGLPCNLFILNGTLKHHFQSDWTRNMFEKFILEKLFRDLHVDDLATCFNNGKLAFSFYKYLKKILALGGFDLCKWFTNSRQLRKKICETGNNRPIDVKTTKNILGVNWDLDNDKFVFKFDEIVSFASTLTVTKRNILKITNKFFDLLGVLSPTVLQAKLIFNKICILKTGWDSEVPVDVGKNWKSSLNFLKNHNDNSFD